MTLREQRQLPWQGVVTVGDWGKPRVAPRSLQKAATGEVVFGDGWERPRATPYSLQRAVPSSSFGAAPAVSGEIGRPSRCARLVIAAGAAVGVQKTAHVLEEESRIFWATFWAKVVISDIGTHSRKIQGLEGSMHIQESIVETFARLQPKSMSRHKAGWILWREHCSSLSMSPGCPKLATMVDFVWALKAGIKHDRGSGRKKNAKGVVSAIRFVAREAAATVLLDIAGDSVVAAVAAGRSDGPIGPPREARPLPFRFVARLELAVVQRHAEFGAADDRLVVLCGFLIMIWSSLRWSDAQRCDIGEISCLQGAVRGRCWRTKSSACGMPFGCLACGLTGSEWGKIAAECFVERKKRCPSQDYMLSVGAGPASYSQGLALLRSLLVEIGGLDAGDTANYSLHSCKKTLLAWALQVGRPFSERAAQGHHRESGQKGVVRTYSGDDVLPAFRLQLALCFAVARHDFRPTAPRGRGAVPPLQQGEFDGKVAVPHVYSWMRGHADGVDAEITRVIDYMEELAEVSSGAESDAEKEGAQVETANEDGGLVEAEEIEFSEECSQKQQTAKVSVAAPGTPATVVSDMSDAEEKGSKKRKQPGARPDSPGTLRLLGSGAMSRPPKNWQRSGSMQP